MAKLKLNECYLKRVSGGWGWNLGDKLQKGAKIPNQRLIQKTTCHQSPEVTANPIVLESFYRLPSPFGRSLFFIMARE